MTDWDLPADMNAAAWDRMAPLRPRSYVCYATSEPPVIDGRLNEPAWVEAPWTERFVDIEGPSKPAPRFETRAAMRWDADHLYVGARLEEPHVWGTLTERNSVMFQDKDFEVFIDPDRDHHNYYELEINALNTIWELTLEKPYRDGGPAISPTNIDGLRTAVHVEGTLNAPHDTDAFWSLEIAIPWEGLARYGTAPPQPGDHWRVNFSRVHWEHDVDGTAYRKRPETPEQNWVWSPQGVIDMHRPERWGIVQFSENAPGETSFKTDPTQTARDDLMAIYYAQRAFRDKHDRWAYDLSDLAAYLAVDVDREIRLDECGDGWTAATWVRVDGDRCALQVHHDSRLLLLP